MGRPRKSNDLCIKNVPPEVLEWIGREHGQHYGGQRQFVLDMLKRAWESSQGQIPLALDASTPIRDGAVSRQGGAAFFNFIDIFAGIGGFRVALSRAGGRCVFSSEWDENCQKTYKSWHGETPHGDIRKVDMADIPDHDVLAAGFPCQPFSLAGVSKKNSLGREHGFRCATQGTLFFHLAEIIEAKRPPVLFLENVRNLLSHDKGQTWATIRRTLEELRYHVFHQVIDAAGWVPQHRERVYIVCFDREEFPERPAFEYPSPPAGAETVLSDILVDPAKVPDKYTLTDNLWNYLQKYAEKHRELGNGFGFGLASPDGIARTLSARYYKDGSEILIPQKGKNPRRLMPEEAARLMGFDEYAGRIVVSDSQAYKQFGNAVVPKVVSAIAGRIVAVLTGRHANRGNGCYMKRAAEPTAR